jgi:RNA polymerase sigma-70 factor (ECF subfamily)
MAQGVPQPATGQLNVGVALALSADFSSANTTGSHHPDADLLAAAARRDAKAFGHLVQRYHGLVYRVVWRMTNGNSEAEDIAQEAFLKLWNNPAQVREAGALKGWLTKVAHNLAMDLFRRAPTADLAAIAEPEDGRANAEDNLRRSWATSRVDLAIAALPERQKLALTLVHFEHFNQSEAASAMDLTLDAFESLLARARRALKEQLNTERQELLAAMTFEG